MPHLSTMSLLELKAALEDVLQGETMGDDWATHTTVVKGYAKLQRLLRATHRVSNNIIRTNWVEDEEEK